MWAFAIGNRTKKCQDGKYFILFPTTEVDGDLLSHPVVTTTVEDIGLIQLDATLKPGTLKGSAQTSESMEIVQRVMDTINSGDPHIIIQYLLAMYHSAMTVLPVDSWDLNLSMINRNILPISLNVERLTFFITDGEGKIPDMEDSFHYPDEIYTRILGEIHTVKREDGSLVDHVIPKFRVICLRTDDNVILEEIPWDPRTDENNPNVVAAYLHDTDITISNIPGYTEQFTDLSDIFPEQAE